MAVEYAGCATVLAGPVCIPEADRRIVVWIPGPVEPPLKLHGARIVDAPEAVQDGRRCRLEIEAGADAVRVEAGGATWSLRVGGEPLPSWRPEVARLRQAGQLDEAERLVQARLDSGPADERGRACAALARIAMQRGRRSEAQALLRQALADHQARGRVLDGVNDAAMLLFTLQSEAQARDEARVVLASLAPGPSSPGQASYHFSYYRGRLAMASGDVRTALRQLDAAARQAQRLGLGFLERAAELVRSEALQQIGRRDEAEAVLDRLRREAPADLPACERAGLLLTLGWNRVLAAEAADDTRAPDAVAPLEDALKALGAGCPQIPNGALHLRLNLALAHLQKGDRRATQASLAASRAETAPSLVLVLWQKEIEARLELADGRPARALERYDELARLAEATLSWGARWRAVAGRAQSLRALGRRDEALAAFAQAEEHLDTDSLQVPVQDGRETFIAGREPVMRGYLELLLRADRAAEAFALVRRSQARVLSALELGERLAGLDAGRRRSWDEALAAYHSLRLELATAAADDWKLPADRLERLRDERAAARRALAERLDAALALLAPERGRTPPRAPREGELILAFHPLPAGLAGFAADARGVSAARLACADTNAPPAQLGPCLLDPFAASIRAARHVTLLPAGAWGSVDVHALPFDGAPLVAGRPVTWSLGLAGRDAAETARRAALVVGDPRGDLPAAREEARAVEASLRADARWSVERVEGVRARYDAIRRRLPEVDLFHFAGHAEFAGRGGWDSVLPLADGADLTIADILAFERAPRWVVLSGCDTARSSRRAGESLGLAQAFLSRGAETVVASTRPVTDDTAAALMRAFYRIHSAGQPVAVALQQAQLSVRDADGRADWPALRVLER